LADPAGIPRSTKRTRTWIIIGVIAAIIVCCALVGVAVVAGGFLAYNSAEETRSESVESQVDALGQETPDSPDDGFFADEGSIREPSEEDIWYEAERVVEHFHPAFHLAMMGLAENSDGVERYNLVAESDQTPGFVIAFMAPRQVASGDVGEGEYVDGESGMLWLHETWGKGGMAAFAGPTPMVNDSMRAGIEASFVGAHAEWVVTDFDLNSNIQVGLNGIHVDDLGFWYGDYVAFESVYDSDLQAGVWRETSFNDLR
jgi:hypothetical protein